MWLRNRPVDLISLAHFAAYDAAAERRNSVAAILVVDDEASVRAVLKGVLKKLGHEVRDAEDGISAITLCRELPPEVAFIDMYMPGQDGIETIRALRKEAPEIKVVAMSGEQLEGGVDILQMASMLGAVAILRKPFVT